MTVEVTLMLPEHIIKHAQRLGALTQQDVKAVLIDALHTIIPTFEDSPDPKEYLPVPALSDKDVLAVADETMDLTQQQRLEDLISKGKELGLRADERYELQALMAIYERGMLRKAEALAVAFERGLRGPMHP